MINMKRGPTILPCGTILSHHSSYLIVCPSDEISTNFNVFRYHNTNVYLDTSRNKITFQRAETHQQKTTIVEDFAQVLMDCIFLYSRCSIKHSISRKPARRHLRRPLYDQEEGTWGWSYSPYIQISFHRRIRFGELTTFNYR